MRSTFALSLLALSLLSGCAVVSVASSAVGLAATAASVTVDAAVGTAKAVGSAAGALMPSGGDSQR
jgi:uncharacterized protein YceK